MIVPRIVHTPAPRGWARPFMTGLLALLLAACGREPAADPTAMPTRMTVGATAAAASPAAGAAAPGATAGRTATAAGTLAPGTAAVRRSTYANPVIDADFPDPDTLRAGDVYYAYATNAATANVQVARSADLVRWQMLADALPVLPAWAQPGFTWAPEVTATAGGGYVLYFTARHTASGRQCIGAATSTTPEGPFAPRGEAPLVCQLDQGGSIDPSSFAEDDGTRYLLWKNDGNCCGMATWIYLQKVSSDGLTLQEAPTRLISGDQAWEGFLVEAPTLWKHAGKYYLFYSANRYSGPDYVIGYAVADTPAGPYRKSSGPLLATSNTNGPVIGPGGQDVVVARDGRAWLVYHDWDGMLEYRGMSIDELRWEGERPVVRGSEGVQQPAP